MIRTAEKISADCILLHAPSVYDFRERDDTLFAYLSDSDSVNVTSVYEMYPLGLFSIQQRLRENHFETEIVNLASIMLSHPEVDIEKLIGRLEAPLYGIDLHWMPHCHGSIEVARIVKKHHPEAMVMFGGISATYYAQQLIRHESVDVVVQGYDTLEPVTMLMQEIDQESRRFDRIPNLLYKTDQDEVVETGFTHKPRKDYNAAKVDWSAYGGQELNPFSTPLIMTLPNTGCVRDCGWCGGSKYAYRNIMGVERTLIQKEHHYVEDELRSMAEMAKRTSIYALQCYSENKSRLHRYIDVAREMGYKSVSFEQFFLPPDDTLRKMGSLRNAAVMLSPESHDPVISKLSGRGTFTMKQLEDWVPKALEYGVEVVVWFFIGMPQQTQQSVMDTVDYCERLMRKFPGGRVLPLICPMVPFLDPGCRFFEEPDKHGYRIFHRTLDDHRQAMLNPLWHERLNYETTFMSRKEIQTVSYEALRRLISTKADLDVLSSRMATKMVAMIDMTTALLDDIGEALATNGGVLPSELRDVIRVYNKKILSYSSDQIVPNERPLAGRWFDDSTVPESMISQCSPQRGF